MSTPPRDPLVDLDDDDDDDGFPYNKTSPNNNASASPQQPQQQQVDPPPLSQPQFFLKSASPDHDAEQSSPTRGVSNNEDEDVLMAYSPKSPPAPIVLGETPPPSLAAFRTQSRPPPISTMQYNEFGDEGSSPPPRFPPPQQQQPPAMLQVDDPVSDNHTPKTTKSNASNSVTGRSAPASPHMPLQAPPQHALAAAHQPTNAAVANVAERKPSRPEGHEEYDEREMGPVSIPVAPPPPAATATDTPAAEAGAPPAPPAKVLTQEEQDQLDRLAAYDEMGDLQALALIKNSQKAVPQVLQRTVGATLHQVERVTDFVVDHIPQPVSRVAHFAGDNVVLLAATTATVLEKGPDVLINAIPEVIMSKATKKLIFVDFNNTLRSFFHTNILAIPFVFNETGLVTGLLLTTFVAACSLYATETFFAAKNMLADASRVMVYGDVPRMTFGDWYPSLNIFYGVIHLISFLAFSAHNMQVVLAAMGITNNAYVWGLVIPCVLSVPLIFMKNAKHQRPLGILSNFLVLLSVILMLTVFQYDAPAKEIQMSTSGSRLIIALGVVIYAFTGIGSAVPVERTMDPALYRKLCRVAVVVSFLLLVGFGLAGYLSYGQSTCAVITLSLDSGKTTTAVAVLLMIASIAIIPQQVFPFAEVMDRRLLGLRKVPDYWERQPNLARLGAMAGCAFIAYAIPWYGLIVSLSGAVGCGILGLIIPAALDYSRRKKIAQKERRRVQWTEYIVITAMIVFGLFTLIVGVLFALFDMWQKLQANDRPGHAICSTK